MSQPKAQPLHEGLGTDEIYWPAAAFLILAPIITLTAMALYIQAHGVHIVDVANFALFYGLTILAITAGYHRYYSHKTYECHRAIQMLYLIVAAASMQNPILNWASNHRYHHQFEDTDRDPYNIKRGFFWAHMGWIFYKELPNRPFANVPDLKRDSLVRWQYTWYWVLVFVVGLGVPTAIGACFGRPMAGLLWGGIFRILVVHQVTYMINSVAHTFGRKTHSKTATARDSHWLAVLSFGEGYHSYHHAYPADYRNGARWFHFDPGKWWIAALASVGLAWNVRKRRGVLATDFETGAQPVNGQA